MTDKASQKMKNTYEAKHKLSNVIIPEDHSLVSFDVKSLFTSIPHELAINCIQAALNSDDDYKSRTSLSKEQLLKLIKICINANNF